MHHAMINKGKMINKERLAEFFPAVPKPRQLAGDKQQQEWEWCRHTQPGQVLCSGHPLAFRRWHRGTAGALQPQPELQDCSGFLLAAVQLA